MGRQLDQNQNYRADFGLVFRSSAIFAVMNDCECTFSIVNYWKIKNGISVSLVVTDREMDGTIVNRRLLDFESADVVNIRPIVSEGSIEIEAFGNRNMRIPYAAVMGLYQTPESIAMVHSYGRNHSPSEIEDETAVLEARESCITVRCAPHIETQVIFHNGHLPVPAQSARLILTKQSGAEQQIEFEMSALAPYQTIRFDIEALAPGFRDFLAGQDGWATFHFENMSAFPRMLVRWRDMRNGAVQTTHSNFDYTDFATNLLDRGTSATLALPVLDRELIDESVVIYPRCTPGQYRVSTSEKQHVTGGGSFVPVSYRTGGRIDFEAPEGQLPSRLVTALYGRSRHDSLPFECSLGIIHPGRPPKRFHWGTVSGRHRSRLHLTTYPNIYEEPHSIEVNFSLYGSFDSKSVTVSRKYSSISEIPSIIDFDDLFDSVDSVLHGDFGYITVTSNWGGFMVYTSMEKGETFSIEHSF